MRICLRTRNGVRLPTASGLQLDVATYCRRGRVHVLTPRNPAQPSNFKQKIAVLIDYQHGEGGTVVS
jgi:hypothetical protein